MNCLVEALAVFLSEKLLNKFVVAVSYFIDLGALHLLICST